MEYFGNYASTRKVTDEELAQIDRKSLNCLSKDVIFQIYHDLSTGLIIQEFFYESLMKRIEADLAATNDFYDCFRLCVENGVHPFDKKKVLELVNPDRYEEILKNRTSADIYVRWKSERIYRYNRITLMKTEAAEEKPVHVFIFCRDVDDMMRGRLEEDERKNKYASGIYALCREYGSVYYVNLESGELSPYNLSNRIEGMFGDEFYKIPYDEAVSKYIDSAVIEADKPMMKKILSRDYIRSVLSKQDTIIRVYLNNENKYCEMKCVRVSRPDNVDAAVYGFAVKDEEIREKLEREKQKDFQLALLDGLSREYHTVFLVHPDKHMELFRTMGSTTIMTAVKYGANSSDCDRSFRMYAERFISEIDREKLLQEITYENIQKLIPTTGVYKVSYERIDENLDTSYYQMCFARARGLNGDEKIIVGFRDVDAIVRRENEEKQKVKSIINERDIDGLTRLWNRACFEKCIRQYPQSGHDTISCVYLDANGLHELNNSKGHEAGDNMLRTVALNIVKYWDGENCFRIGGDEFIVFLFDYDLRQLAEEVDALQGNVRRAGYSVAVGYTVTTIKDLDMDQVIKTAENLMYYEKKKYYTGDKDRRRGENGG